MHTTTSQRIWLVGGSEGIGLELVKKWVQQGHKLVVSSRSADSSEPLNELVNQNPEQIKLLNMDVMDENDVSTKSEQAWQTFSGLDVWFYNAGAYNPMTIEEWDLKAFEAMNQVNYLGCVRLMIALKDKFLAQQHGRWIWNVSLASDFGLPYGGGYSAPKAALQNLAESLQPELSRKKILLQVINHGFVKTRLTKKNDFAMLGLMEPEQAATQICKVLESKRFETRFPFSLASILGTIKKLPKSWALKLTAKSLK